MLGTARRLLIGPLLAVGVAGGALVLDAGAASAAPAPATGTVRVSGTLKVRAAATNASAQVGTLRNRAAVTLACKVTGQYTKGNVRKTAQWDRLTSGAYISHGYVQVKRNVTLPACPPPPVAVAAGPGPVSGPLTTASNAAFLAAAAGPAQASQREFRVPASVTLAQAILESGWGRSGLSNNDRNYFGMKCFGNPGPIAVGCHVYNTTECDAAGVCFPTTATFRVYNSATDSFRDHGRQLATMSRYAAAFNYTKDPNRFAAEVHKAGYATDPDYTNKLVRLMTQYNLYQYDLR